MNGKLKARIISDGRLLVPKSDVEKLFDEDSSHIRLAGVSADGYTRLQHLSFYPIDGAFFDYALKRITIVKLVAFLNMELRSVKGDKDCDKEVEKAIVRSYVGWVMKEALKNIRDMASIKAGRKKVPRNLRPEDCDDEMCFAMLRTIAESALNEVFPLLHVLDLDDDDVRRQKGSAKWK